jgi:hypothetical protein
MGIPARVDLFVVGDKFYQGSTRKKLEYGWCDFLALGREFASYFGSSRVMGTVWYLAQEVPPDLLRSFEENKRQRMWLCGQGDRVARIIIDGAEYGTRQPGALVPGSEFRCKREQDAVAALSGQNLAPEALLFPRTATRCRHYYHSWRKDMTVSESFWCRLTSQCGTKAKFRSYTRTWRLHI